MLLDTYRELQKIAIKEISSIDQLLTHFVRVTDVDNSPDLTDVHPRDRKDIDLHFTKITQSLYPKTFEYIQKLSGVKDSVLIGFGPQSQLYPHVDTVDLPPYSGIDWVSVYIGIMVPSYDIDKVAVKVGEQIFDHRDIIIFDTQIPHSAWNWTDSWWISLRLSIDKRIFQ
jgi:hypothetical protein